MQGQTLRSEAHWDNLQHSASTGSCPPVHKYTHGLQPWTWCPCLTVGNTPSLLWVFVQHAGQRRREDWGLLHNHAGQLSWLRWLLVGTMTFNRKHRLGEKHQQDLGQWWKQIFQSHQRVGYSFPLLPLSVCLCLSLRTTKRRLKTVLWEPV